MGMGNAPVIILREGTKRDKGKDAQFNNISAARAISDAVRSTHHLRFYMLFGNVHY